MTKAVFEYIHNRLGRYEPLKSRRPNDLSRRYVKTSKARPAMWRRLFDRITARIHASRESSLESIHLLVVCGLGLIGLLLRLCTCRLRRLFLGLLVRLALFPSAANCTDSRADSRSSACISRDCSDRRSTGSTLRSSARTSSLGLWRVRGGLLFGSLHLARRGA